jgi:hypothetical protein
MENALEHLKLSLNFSFFPCCFIYGWNWEGHLDLLSLKLISYVQLRQQLVVTREFDHVTSIMDKQIKLSCN